MGTTHTRRDLRLSVADGVACTVMVACGEMSLPLVAVAAGLGAFGAAAVATAPMLVGAVVQLLAPLAMGRVRGVRRWVVACVIVQALSFVPIAVQAARGSVGLPDLLIAASVYWSAGMASLAAWSVWMAELVPPGVRPRFFAFRSRLALCGMIVGLGVSGAVLFVGDRWGMKMPAFAVLFGIAIVARLVSAACMAACSDPLGHAVTRAIEATRPVQIVEKLVATVREMATRPSGPLVAYLVCFVFGTNVAAPYLTPYLVNQRNLTEATVVCLSAAAFAGRLVALPSLGRLAARTGAAPLVRGATLALACVTGLWMASGAVPFLAPLQFIAGCSWAAHELAVTLLLFNAVGDRERVAVVTLHTLGSTAAATAGAACGGLLMKACGEGLPAFRVVFITAAAVQVASLLCSRRVGAFTTRGLSSRRRSGTEAARRPAQPE